AACARIYQLFNGIGLFLRVFFVRGPPVDFNVYSVFLAQLLCFVLSAGLSRLEYGVVVGFGNDAKRVGLFRSKTSRCGQAEEARYWQSEFTNHFVWVLVETGVSLVAITSFLMRPVLANKRLLANQALNWSNKTAAITTRPITIWL